MSAISSLLDALFATRCELCGRMGPTCCEDCWRNLSWRVRAVTRQNLHGKVLAGTAAIDFDPAVSQLVHAFKDSGRSVLANRFAPPMAAALAAGLGMGGIFGAGSTSSPQPSAAASPPPSNATSAANPGLSQTATASSSADLSATSARIHLVAVPSRLSSIQSRGFSPGADIAKALISQLEPRWGARRFEVATRFSLASRWLWRSAESADQAELGQRARTQNLLGTMAASPRASGKSVILVDDIVTTGASLFEATRALEAKGAQVVGFVTFAETILRKIANMPTGETKKV